MVPPRRFDERADGSPNHQRAAEFVQAAAGSTARRFKRVATGLCTLQPLALQCAAAFCAASWMVGGGADLQTTVLVLLAAAVATAGRREQDAPPGLPSQRARAATIYLVGAGPGDPSLLTVRARDLIESADVVLSDRLVPEGVLALVRAAGGRLRVASKAPGHVHSSQQELNDWGLEALRAGLSVVRLKQGDPCVFGRATEEIQLFRRHGFPPQLVPGISSALAAATSAGIPITQRGVASEVVIATGMGRDGSATSVPRFSPARTVVLLMAVHRLPVLQVCGPRPGHSSHSPHQHTCCSSTLAPATHTLTAACLRPRRRRSYARPATRPTARWPWWRRPTARASA